MIPFDTRICELGEGPIWHPAREQFFWFDILNRRLLSRDADRAWEWRFERMASAAGWVDHDRLLIATETGLALMDLRDGDLHEIAQIESDNPQTRSNDGRADRQGGFWIGTMGKQAADGAGAIWRWYRGELRRLVESITIPNAICFSPDGSVAHYADTRAGKVWRQALDNDGWPQGAPALYLDCAAMGLNPDGAVIDSHGAFCVACWGSGAVIRFATDGTRIDSYDVGGRHSSCPAFGGPDMRDLLVTTAQEGIKNPDAAQGLPYLIRAAVPGLPEPRVIL
ncbi:SMP-30/gluconolactonase/LRE family protein [Paracoccus sp. R12_1]|uniref:SMP-30/gluconolactonase/LRE family protein n=1 Tax=unclassified Paracoccus (in: a-proteobacteria) TaxID=2688777 RepID=UPI001ADAD6D4|nr:MULTISPECIES: SMP-30/gluconolactonase/LRE family protein [unclassified Paracoccus (in: a-proteobacteria)]MBO9454227.1 SMP-30/gluconolactonase/LRE family protein [Paracoccus sp. R12_2]MBO9485013.1 SMP-30/gluconolactonase/LRE family protein [Paracoccus sp. R12_1]